jgi:hypothetical protein
MLCGVDSCDRPLYARGLCQPHYKRLRRHGDVFAEIPIGRSLKPCSVEGCPNDLEARG